MRTPGHRKEAIPLSCLIACRFGTSTLMDDDLTIIGEDTEDFIARDRVTAWSDTVVQTLTLLFEDVELVLVDRLGERSSLRDF